MNQMRIFLRSGRDPSGGPDARVMVAVGSRGLRCRNRNQPAVGRPLTTLVTSLTGPVAYAISVIAIVALGATLAFAAARWARR